MGFILFISVLVEELIVERLNLFIPVSSHNFVKVLISRFTILGNPFELDPGEENFNPSIVNIFEVLEVSTIFRDFLNLTVNIVNSFTSVFKMGKLIDFKRFIERISVLSMEPNIDQIIVFTDMELLNLRRRTSFASLDVFAIISFRHLFDIVISMVRAFLFIQMFRVNALTSLTIERPTVEGTFNAAIPFNLTTNTKVGTHVRAVSMEGISNTIFTTENSDVTTIKLKEL